MSLWFSHFPLVWVGGILCLDKFKKHRKVSYQRIESQNVTSRHKIFLTRNYAAELRDKKKNRVEGVQFS